MIINKPFYYLKPFIPRPIQISIRRMVGKYKRVRYKHIWPIDPASAKIPPSWKGWPENKKFAFILSHDVDTKKGLDKCIDLTKLEMELGFRSSFNFVPERYKNSPELREFLVKNGFEVAVHGLKHDGKLYWSKKIFDERAIKINQYLHEWNAVGFHSPAMQRNLEWIHELDIVYDQSTFDTDPFEPHPDGVSTIFPFWLQNGELKRGYVELPYTLPQDHLLFIILKENNINIWKKKLDWVAEQGGMALLNTHPDYMNFDKTMLNSEEYPAKFYREFLEYVMDRYKNQYWHALPNEVAEFWIKNMVKG